MSSQKEQFNPSSSQEEQGGFPFVPRFMQQSKRSRAQAYGANSYDEYRPPAALIQHYTLIPVHGIGRINGTYPVIVLVTSNHPV